MAKTKRQPNLPTMEKKSIREIDVAAEAYVEVRDERMKLTEDEVEKREALIAAMKKAHIESYRDDDASPPLLITLIAGEDRVKVSRVAEDDAEAA